MTITKDDIVLYESQKLTDESDGGGRATGKQVVSGQFNNLFEDISRLDRTVGDVALRKAFVGVNTATADTYLGAHVVISELTDDERVNVLLFEATGEGDTRADAQNAIESYVVRSAAAPIDLLGNQIKGQRQIVCFQRVESDIPGVGDVFVLSLEDNSVEQYVKISSVEHSIETFQFQLGSSFVSFDRRRLVLGLTSELEITFPGGTPRPDGVEGVTAVVSYTQPADAARYYGATKTSAPVSVGDLKIPVESIFASLVPSAQSEQPIIDQSALRNVDSIVQAGTAKTITSKLKHIGNSQFRSFAPRAVLPGSAKFTAPNFTLEDNGEGKLIHKSGSFPVTELEIDYASGTISGVITGTTADFDGSLLFTPGAVNPSNATSGAIRIAVANQSYNYTLNLAGSKPRPGTLRVSYMALGKWYIIADTGRGDMSGDGSGSVNFQTGSAAFTLKALPDAGSNIVFEYVADIADELEFHAGNATIGTPEFELGLQSGVKRGSLSLTFVDSGTHRTITDSDGSLTGSGSGSIDYGAGVVRVRPSVIPDDGTDFTIAYEVGSAGQTKHVALAITPDSSGTATGTLPDIPIQPGSVSVAARSVNQWGWANKRIYSDNGAGALGNGSINYATGEFTFNALPSAPSTTWSS